jgi:predicted MFS family arabinose efflux permease
VPGAGAPCTVLATLVTTLLWATGSFTFFTYVGVILHRTASAGASGLAGFLLLFGLMGLAGAATAGWLALASGGDERLLLSLNASALYAGVGLGGAIGGVTLALSGAAAAVCWTAAGIELAALALVGAGAVRARAGEVRTGRHRGRGEPSTRPAARARSACAGGSSAWAEGRGPGPGP